MEFPRGAILLLVLLTYQRCCLCVCPSEPCSAHSHCADQTCVCDEGYYESNGICRVEYPECGSEESLLTTADRCQINRTSVDILLAGDSAHQCGKYRQSVACAVTYMKMYIQPACSEQFIMAAINRYMARLVAGSSAVDFESYTTCVTYRRKVVVQAKQATWTNDLKDKGGPAYWGIMKQYSPLMYRILTTAFPDRYVTHSVVDVRQGSVLLHVIFELTEDATLVDVIKEIAYVVKRPEYAEIVDLDIVAFVGMSCSRNGESIPDGTRFLEDGGCNNCLCNNGQITCSTMDCNSVWLYEYCSVTDDCATGNSVCLHNRCWCDDGFYDVIDVAEDPIGQCKPLKAFGESCDERRECVAVRGDCRNSTCGCDVMYDAVDGVCSLPLRGPCETTPDCDVRNSECQQLTCQCRQGFYDKDGACAKLKWLGEACSSTTDCGNASSECRTGICACLTGFFQAESGCEPVKSLGDVCTDQSGCGSDYLECDDGACECGAEYYIHVDERSCNPGKQLGEACNTTAMCVVDQSQCRSKICTCKAQYHKSGATCQPDEGGPSDSDMVIGAAVGASVGGLIFFSMLACFLWYRRRKHIYRVKKSKKTHSPTTEEIVNEMQRQYGLPGVTAPGSVFVAAGKKREVVARYQAPVAMGADDDSSNYEESHYYDNVGEAPAHGRSAVPTVDGFTDLFADEPATYDRIKPSGSAVVVCVTPVPSPAPSPTRDMLRAEEDVGPITFFEPGSPADYPTTQDGRNETEARTEAPASDDVNEANLNPTYYKLSPDGNTIVVCVTPAGSPSPSPTQEAAISWPTEGHSGRQSPLSFGPTGRSSPTRDLIESAEKLATIADPDPEGNGGSPTTSPASSPRDLVSYWAAE